MSTMLYFQQLISQLSCISVKYVSIIWPNRDTIKKIRLLKVDSHLSYYLYTFWLLSLAIYKLISDTAWSLVSDQERITHSFPPSLLHSGQHSFILLVSFTVLVSQFAVSRLAI